jgi:hypothetical protein
MIDSKKKFLCAFEKAENSNEIVKNYEKKNKNTVVQIKEFHTKNN